MRVNDPDELNAHGLHFDRICIFQEVASWDQEEHLTLELDRCYVREASSLRPGLWGATVVVSVYL